MRIMVVVVAVSATLAVGSGCASQLDQVVRNQAAADLNCPVDQVSVLDLRSDNYVRDFQAKGCGREAQYQAACGMVGGCVAYTPEQAGATPTVASQGLGVSPADFAEIEETKEPAPADADADAAELEASEPPPPVVLGPPRTITLRSDCPNTVALWLGTKPGESGRTATLGAGNSAAQRISSGEQVWLLDRQQQAIVGVAIDDSVSSVQIAESCTGLSAQ